MRLQINAVLPYFLLFLTFVAAVLFRPLLPIDETRYLTVAWEMFLQKSYAVMSLNFEPYHHKPPMLFWMINAAWEIFGVSRWAALLPIFASSALVLFLTKKLSTHLLGEKATETTQWILLGSIPFLIYSSLVMFDMTVTALLLACILTYISHVKDPKWHKPVLAGLLMGAGILTKGPVMLLYVLWPLLLYPVWREDNFISPKKLYLSVLASLLICIVPVLIWLIPVFKETNDNFAFWLVWNQTAGRVTGNFSSAHSRPFYFYLMLSPLLFMPWIFFPSAWKKIKDLNLQSKAMKFLLCAVVPVFLSFSFISGKQPHYLLPLLPFITIFIACLFQDIRLPYKKIVTGLVTILILGQAYASHTHFKDYELEPFAAVYNEHKDAHWAFVRNYQGEIGFLARAEKPIESLNLDDLKDWFKQHPDGYAIVRYKNENMDQYELILSKPYRGKKLGIFRLKDM